MKHKLNCRVIICGSSNVGKTAFLEKLINNTTLTEHDKKRKFSAGLEISNNKSSSQSSSSKEQSNFTSNVGSNESGKNENDNSNPHSNSNSHGHTPTPMPSQHQPQTYGGMIGNFFTGSSQNLDSPNMSQISTSSTNLNSHDQNMNIYPSSNKEDIYLCTVNSERGPATVRIHDTPGKNWQSDASNTASPPRHYCHFGDGFMLFFDLTDLESFKNLEFIKSEIYRERDRREVHLVVVGMKKDLTEEESSMDKDKDIAENQKSLETSSSGKNSTTQPITAVDSKTINQFIEREKLAYFECSIKNRGSLSGPVQHIINKMIVPVKTGLLSRRLMR